MTIEITKCMCVVALEAYWGKRPYNPRKRQQWTDKELEGMHDAIRAALSVNALENLPTVTEAEGRAMATGEATPTQSPQETTSE